MITNSLNIKGQQKGTSPKEHGFPCVNMNSKNPQRELDFAYHKPRQRYLQIFFALIFMGAFTQSYAQSGASCSNPINLGNFVKDTTLTVSINYPDTVKWVQFTSNSNSIRLLAYSAANNNGKIKLKELNLYDGFCSPITNNITTVYPGQEAIGFKHISITPNVVYKIKLTRYYDVSLNDTPNVAIYLKYRGGSPAVCSEGSCGNLVLDGGFENHVSPLISGDDLDELECWSPPQLGADPKNFHTNYTPEWQIPNQFSFGVLGINLPTQNDEIYTSSFSNEGYIGVRTNNNSSDIVQGSLSTSLQANKLYFVTYLVSPGKAGYDSFHDRIDLDILDPTALYNYNPSFWGAGYSLHQPILESEVIDFNQDWSRVSNVFDSDLGGQAIIYIGNLAKQAYSNTVGANPANSYYIDNLIVKPFELELGPDIVACEGQVIDLTIPCQYLYPGATYEWDTDDPNITLPYTQPNLSFTATGNYYYKLIITVTNPQGNTPPAATDVVNVTITQPPTIGIQVMGGPQGTYCEVDGILYVVQGNQVSLTASGAGANGTYDWYINGTLTQSNQSYFFTPGLAPVGDYQIVVIGSDSICSGSDTINVTIVNTRCQLPCNTVLGESFFTNSDNYLPNDPHLYPNTTSANFGTLQTVGQPLQNLTYVVDGTFTISANTFLQFNDVTILVSPGGRIVNNGTFNLIDCVVDGCEQMWNNIENRNSLGALRTTFRHAESAIEVFGNSWTRVDDCNFFDNVVGIYSIDIGNNFKTLNHFRVIGSEFRRFQGFLPPFDATFSQYTGNQANPVPGTNAFPQPPMPGPVNSFAARPASGILLKDVQMANNVLTIGDNTQNPNIFENMWNGISLNHCIANITNCRFEGMQATVNHGQWILNLTTQPLMHTNQFNWAWNLGQRYNAIHSNAISLINSTVTVNPLVNNSLINPTMNNCFRGIFTQTSFTTIQPILQGDEFFMTNVSTGVRSANAPAVVAPNLSIRIIDTDINANIFGVVIEASAPSSAHLIQSNDITITRNAALGTTAGGIGIQKNDFGLGTNAANINTSSNITCNILDNNIDILGGQYGIEFRNASDGFIANNVIDMTFLQGVNNSDYSGIVLWNCFNTDVACNSIQDNRNIAYNTQNANNSGLFSNSSEGTRIRCNNTDNFRNGLLFQASCVGTALRNNNITDHEIGLNYLISANVGVQLLAGNNWNGNYSLNGAKFGTAQFSPTIAQLQANEFRENPLSFPPNIFPTSDWFLNQPGTAINECNNVIGCITARNQEREPNYLVNLLKIAENTKDSSLFEDESLWQKNDYLFRQLSKNDSLKQLYPNLTARFDSLDTTAMAVISKVLIDMNKLYLGNASQQSQYFSLITNKLNLWQSLQEANANNDSITAASLANQLMIVENALVILNAQIDITSQNLRAALLNTITQISPSNLIESNFKTVIQIYLENMYKDSIGDLLNDENIILSIANQCPLSGGDAVFMARFLYEYIQPNINYNDDFICNAVSNERRENKSKQVSKEQFMNKTTLLPNPSNGQINIFNSSAEIGQIKITEISGKVVLLKDFNQGQHFVSLDCSILTKGIYFVEITSQQTRTETIKLVLN